MQAYEAAAAVAVPGDAPRVAELEAEVACLLRTLEFTETCLAAALGPTTRSHNTTTTSNSGLWPRDAAVAPGESVGIFIT